MKFLLIASAAATVVSTSVAAQTAAPQAPAPLWDVEWRSPSCTATTGVIQQLAVSIWTVPGSNSVEIYLTGPKAPKLPQQSEARIRLIPTGEIIPAQVSWNAPSWNGVLKLVVYGHDFLAKFGRSSQLDVEGSGKSLSVGFQGAADVAARLQQCSDAVARQWGVDPKALASLDFQPEGTGGWLSYQDYPRDALDANHSGTVVARLTVNEAGKVTGCTVVASSGMKSMDEVTCRSALKRAKYKPAIGADGQPKAVTFITFATFRVWG
jgi:TonB family protein